MALWVLVFGFSGRNCRWPKSHSRQPQNARLPFSVPIVRWRFSIDIESSRHVTTSQFYFLFVPLVAGGGKLMPMADSLLFSVFVFAFVRRNGCWPICGPSSSVKFPISVLDGKSSSYPPFQFPPPVFSFPPFGIIFPSAAFVSRFDWVAFASTFRWIFVQAFFCSACSCFVYIQPSSEIAIYLLSHWSDLLGKLLNSRVL